MQKQQMRQLCRQGGEGRKQKRGGSMSRWWRKHLFYLHNSVWSHDCKSSPHAACKLLWTTFSALLSTVCFVIVHAFQEFPSRHFALWIRLSHSSNMNILLPLSASCFSEFDSHKMVAWHAKWNFFQTCFIWLFHLGGGPKKAFGKENGLQKNSQGDWTNVL